MDHRIASARPLGRALTATMAAAGLLAAAALFAAPAALAADAAQAAGRSRQRRQAGARAPQQARSSSRQQQAAADQPQLMYSPWMKVCGKGPETNNKQVCVITKDGRLENGMPVAVVQLFEPEGEQKVLRVTVPLGMQLQHGTRMLIDQDQPAQQPYRICFPIGCMSDYPVTDDMIGKMKKGQSSPSRRSTCRARRSACRCRSTDFAKAYDGPPPIRRCSRSSSASCRKSCRRKPKRRARSWKASSHRLRLRRRPAAGAEEISRHAQSV